MFFILGGGYRDGNWISPTAAKMFNLFRWCVPKTVSDKQLCESVWLVYKAHSACTLPVLWKTHLTPACPLPRCSASAPESVLQLDINMTFSSYSQIPHTHTLTNSLSWVPILAMHWPDFILSIKIIFIWPLLSIDSLLIHSFWLSTSAIFPFICSKMRRLLHGFGCSVNMFKYRTCKQHRASVINGDRGCSGFLSAQQIK